VGHASVALVPSSPLQTTHVFEVPSHTGVALPHVLLSTQATHLPALGPVPAQSPERHTRGPVPEVHAPPPLAYPQSLSASHTPATHARSPRGVVHVPPGTGLPFCTRGWQRPAAVTLLHQLPVPHSASVVQVFPHAPEARLQKGPACVPVVQSVSAVQVPQVPLAPQKGSALVGHASVVLAPSSPLQTTHVFDVPSQTGVAVAQVALETQASHLPAFGPVVAQIVDRHTTGPVEDVHVGSPLARPQSPSLSQTPETQAREAIVETQAFPGTGFPLVTCGWHTPAPARLSHQLPLPHSASVLQLLPHAPVAVLQKGPRWPAPQSLSFVQVPQLPPPVQ
jgi:hypothetical protein